MSVTSESGQATGQATGQARRRRLAMVALLVLVLVLAITSGVLARSQHRTGAELTRTRADLATSQDNVRRVAGERDAAAARELAAVKRADASDSRAEQADGAIGNLLDLTDQAVRCMQADVATLGAMARDDYDTVLRYFDDGTSARCTELVHTFQRLRDERSGAGGSV